MNITENSPKIKVKNVCICPSNREMYKYIIVREVNDEYWFYGFANNLFLASRTATFELNNGIVIELENVIGEE